MALNVLYIEDDDDHFNMLDEAIAVQNSKMPDSAKVILSRTLNPDQLQEKLNHSLDVVLADVCYENAPQADGNINRLDEIIQIVKVWADNSRRGRPLPVIALTSKGKKFVEFCIKRKAFLYDIWDKTAASPEYRAWKLTQLATELPRYRPDALIQRKITEMFKGASWHEHVKDMIRRYDQGLTESDQVKRAGEAVIHIAEDLGGSSICSNAWKAILDAEPLIRAACPSTRGHARHVLNVFWMGYYLLHHECLNEWVTEILEKIVKSRENRNMAHVSEMDPLEAVGIIWFFAGVFHDTAYLMERSDEIQNYHLKVLKCFRGLNNESLKPQNYFSPNLTNSLSKFIDNEFEIEKHEHIVAAIKEISKKNISQKAPDHGLIGGFLLSDDEPKDKESYLLRREASRAIALHHIVCETDEKEVIGLLSWEKEPLACLLLLCDQLQTWDRERLDESYRNDLPSRAELSRFNLSSISGYPHLEVAIDYIAPAHLEKSPKIFERVKDDLDRILSATLKPALNLISGKWPFTINITTTMSGDEMNTKVQIPT